MRLAALIPLAALAGCAATAAQAPAAPSGLTPQQIVAARQSAFHLSAATLGSMKGVVDSGGEVKPLTFGARGLARWAKTLPTMFPEGTQLADSRALPTVWTDRAGFDARAAAFAAATDRLAAAADAGDKAAFAEAWKATGASCGACHDAYRAEAKN